MQHREFVNIDLIEFMALLVLASCTIVSVIQGIMLIWLFPRNIKRWLMPCLSSQNLLFSLYQIWSMHFHYIITCQYNWLFPRHRVPSLPCRTFTASRAATCAYARSYKRSSTSSRFSHSNQVLWSNDDLHSGRVCCCLCCSHCSRRATPGFSSSVLSCYSSSAMHGDV